MIILLILLSLVCPVLASQPAELNPISLQDIAAKQFNGSDLKIVKTLAKTSKYTRYLINYKSGDLNISGIMNVPLGKGPFPVVITNHGHIPPRIYTVGRGLKREQDYLANRGLVVIHPDYRNHGLSDKDPGSESGFRLGYVEDVINLVYAIKASDYKFLDKENIGMMGHSLGGGICLNIMVTKPDLVKAFVLYAPVSGDYVDNFNRWIRRGRSGVAEKIIAEHGSPEANPKFWRNLSAIYFLDKVEAPVEIHHGTKDESCFIEWSEKLDKAFKEAGKPVAFYKYIGEKHEFIKQWPAFMKRTAKFFKQNLK